MQLRPFQREALEALSMPGHLICVAPTGAGKSLIYERAARVPGRRTLLVTPLVALARQQHERLARGANVGLGAGQPSEGPPPGDGGIWIVSPERLLSPSSLDELRRWRPTFLVVDECHCLWEWGESFRPAFRALPGLIRELGIGTSLWLTATLPLEARRELRAALPPPLRELGAFDLPPKLQLSVSRVGWPERADALVGWVRQQRAPGIVFAPTRESTRRLERLISATGVATLAYHAGMGAEERRAAERRVRDQSVQALVATSAFGMGMDYPHLEWALLWQAPTSLLAFAQAVGRVGRDPSRIARAITFWDDEDFRLLEWTLGRSERRREQLRLVRELLGSTRCRRAALKSYFEFGFVNSPTLPGVSPECCMSCDICLTVLFK